jgi:nicotinamide-nucleotide amidase
VGTNGSRGVGELAEACARSAHERGLWVVAAESLTSGQIAGALGKASDAAEWFAGSIVAYGSETKFQVLGVERGPVVTAAAARQMALGALGLTGADVAVAVTGVGGPGPEEDQPAGTVFLACGTRDDGVEVTELHFVGGPEDVVRQTVTSALICLLHKIDTLLHKMNTS